MAAKKKTKSKKVVVKPVVKKTPEKRYLKWINKLPWWHRNIFVRLTIVLLILTTLVWIFWQLPIPADLSTNAPVSTKLFDRNGKLLYEIYSEKRRSPIPLDEIPDHVKKATIAIEDKDFYKHHGFSITGITRGLYNTIFRQKVQGGSTLTQQLVKNALLSPERTVRRKIREFILTMWVEARYSKDQILDLYLNQIPYGGTAYGIEAAAETFFDKKAKDLSLAEAALLAGLPAAPSKYSPFGTKPEFAKNRQETVLRRMVEDKYITQEDADKAKSAALVYKEQEVPLAPHFALWIKETLAEKYGDALVERGGLRVTTSLDLDVQNEAQNAVATEVARLKKQKVGNGAVLVTKPKTGEILAMVGSKDYFATDEDGKVNIIFAKRQPGSSIKPLNYALAIKDKKITAATALADVPTCFSSVGQEIYCPKNYDGSFHGLVQTRFAVGNSYNIPAVRVLALNGLENFIDFARSMGITTFTDPKNYGLSLTLGGGEIRMYDMAVAFGVFANQGVKVPLVSILKVEDWKGKVLEEANVDKIEGERVLDPGVTYIVSHILLDNNARVQAFGERSLLNVSGHSEVSVKTGTTNDRRDNWTIGYTPQAVVVTWVGNNDYTPMSGAVSGVSGASPIWNKVMKYTLGKAEKGEFDKNEKNHAWPRQPDNVVGMNICATTGTLPSDTNNPGCPMRFEYFLKDSLPPQGSVITQDLQIDKTSGAVASSSALPENIETRSQQIYIDPLKTLYCLTCPLPNEAVTIRYPFR